MTYRRLLAEAAGRLERASVPEPRADARALLFEAFGLDTAAYLLCADEAVPEGAAAARFEEWIARREAREPLQYITGCAWFAGRRFFVTEAVLIPRQDTETLVAEVARRYPPGSESGRLLDLCTGSGCILLSLLARGCFAQGTGTDISQDALDIARANAAALGLQARFACGDLYAAVPGEVFDVITANPPYVTEDEYAGLDEEVKREPKTALTADEEGLAVFRRIAAGAAAHLSPGGMIFAEIGCAQREAAARILTEAGFADIACVKDVAGRDRVMRARKEET